MRKQTFLAATTISYPFSLVDSLSFAESCHSFDPTQHLTNTTLRVLEHVPANTTIPLQGMDSTCNRQSQNIPVESCRIALTLPTSNRSSIIFELFLPTKDTWTGRFLGTGNGGIDGCIKYEDIAYGLYHGFAATGSNNGHNGTGGEAFLNNPDVVTDFSHRSIHAVAEAGKTLTEAFYGEAHTKSYYIGCSGGGRQGIQAAYLNPEDYDGILAGAPALHFNYMSAWRASFFTITGSANDTRFIPASVWQSLVRDEVLKQCDELDGVDDGIIVDSRGCAETFNPEPLQCSGENTDNCLTAEQVDVVRKVFSPLYGIDGELIYPGLAPGAESLATQRLLSGTPFPPSFDWYRYAVYSEPSWDPASWTVEDAKAPDAKNPGNSRAWPSDLSTYGERGGKLLLYHGSVDQQITGFNTERWYDYLLQGMQTSTEEQDKFLRFFRVPGHSHCNGGAGAWQFGQNLVGAAGLGFDAETNILKALIEWVENDRAPETIIGTKFVNDSAALGIQSQRKHCRYPLQSTYVGSNLVGIKSWDCKGKHA